MINFVRSKKSIYICTSNLNTMGTVILVVVLVLVVGIGAILIYRNNQKKAEAGLASIEKTVATVKSDVAEVKAKV